MFLLQVSYMKTTPFYDDPLENCGAISKEHSISWINMHCEYSLDWICEIKKGRLNFTLSSLQKNTSVAEFHILEQCDASYVLKDNLVDFIGILYMEQQAKTYKFIQNTVLQLKTINLVFKILYCMIILVCLFSKM